MSGSFATMTVFLPPAHSTRWKNDSRRLNARPSDPNRDGREQSLKFPEGAVTKDEGLRRNRGETYHECAGACQGQNDSVPKTERRMGSQSKPILKEQADDV
jgi:hypothetical protein